MVWDQKQHLGASVNTTLDPYYLCFLDENAPTIVGANGNRTIDLSRDLSGSLISGIEFPCVIEKPKLISSRRGGTFLNGQRRDIPLARSYVKGMISLNPGTPEDFNACLAAATLVSRVWIVIGGAFPANTPSVWPFSGNNPDRFRDSAIFASSFTLKKQKELKGAEMVTGAMIADFQYFGTVSALSPS